MPYIRLSHARNSYTCGKCGSVISRRAPYFRDDPYPFARMRGVAETRHLCMECVLGKDAAAKFLSAVIRSDQLPSDQLPLGFELTRNGFLRFPALIEVADITPQIIQLLGENPERIRELSPDKFEDLICNRLDGIGFDLERVGSNAFQKDGGIDIIAWPRSVTVPFLMAVQVKHTTSAHRTIGPGPVRELMGAVEMHNLNVGMLVTNTTFTPDARWAAQQRPFLMRLRDIEDLQRWLRGEDVLERGWQDIPSEIQVCPGVIVKLGRG